MFWVLPPLGNSWIVIILWLYIALNRTPNIDCYWTWGSTQGGLRVSLTNCFPPSPRQTPTKTPFGQARLQAYMDLVSSGCVALQSPIRIKLGFVVLIEVTRGCLTVDTPNPEPLGLQPQRCPPVDNPALAKALHVVDSQCSGSQDWP